MTIHEIVAAYVEKLIDRDEARNLIDAVADTDTSIMGVKRKWRTDDAEKSA